MTARPLLLRVLVAAVLALLLAALLGEEPVPAALAGPVEDLAVDRDPDNAIRGTVQVVTEDDTTVVVHATAPGHDVEVAWTGAPGTEHEVPLLGLLPDTTYRVDLTVLGADGDELASARIDDLATAPMPDELPPTTVEVLDEQRVSPGLTLFNSIYRDPLVGERAEYYGYIQVVDETGRIVWYHREPGRVQQLVRDDDGNFLYGIDEDATRLITPSGEVLGEWRGFATGSEPGAEGFGLDGQVVDLGIHSTHHETLPLDDGTYVTLSRTTQEIAYPDGLCEDESAPGDVELIVGDSVVVFDPETGEVLEELRLDDAQDPRDDPRPQQPDYCSSGYLNPQFPEDSDPRDWTHANAVIPIDGGDTWLVSARHTDSLWALRAVADEGGPVGSLRWELGRDTGWEMLGDGQWFFHQHAPELQPDGSILLYDNGNFRDDAEEPYSRAVRYEIDPESRTIEQVWEHRMDPDVYAPFVGDADRLDGTVLITHGGLRGPCDVEMGEDDSLPLAAQLVEVDEATGDVVWHLVTSDRETCTGWGAYRAERIPTLYPAGWEVTETRG